MDDLEPKPKPQITVGQDLSEASVSELQERIILLEGEIERTRAAMEAKSAALKAADAVFGSPKGKT